MSYWPAAFACASVVITTNMGNIFENVLIHSCFFIPSSFYVIPAGVFNLRDVFVKFSWIKMHSTF